MQSGNTPLAMAATDGLTDMVRALLDAGAAVNAQRRVSARRTAVGMLGGEQTGTVSARLCHTCAFCLYPQHRARLAAATLAPSHNHISIPHRLCTAPHRLHTHLHAPANPPPRTSVTTRLLYYCTWLRLHL